MAQNGRKIESSATPIKFFSVDSYSQETMSFKFDNDIFIIFEMPKNSTLGLFENLALLKKKSEMRYPASAAVVGLKCHICQIIYQV